MAAAAAATTVAVGDNFYWRQRGNGDEQMAIDFSNLGEFQRQNQCEIEFVWVNKDKNRLSGLNLPGSVNVGGGGGGDEHLNRKLTFAVDNFPPRFGIDQCFLLTKVQNDNLQPRFCCSTPKCFYTTFRADHLVKHQSKCTVSFFY